MRFVLPRGRQAVQNGGRRECEARLRKAARAAPPAASSVTLAPERPPRHEASINESGHTSCLLSPCLGQGPFLPPLRRLIPQRASLAQYVLSRIIHTPARALSFSRWDFRQTPRAQERRPQVAAAAAGASLAVEGKLSWPCPPGTRPVASRSLSDPL